MAIILPGSVLFNGKRSSPAQVPAKRLKSRMIRSTSGLLPKSLRKALLFAALHGADNWIPPSELLLAHFASSDGHLCVISYAKISECDSPSDYYFLYVIDKQGNVKEPIEIRNISGGYGRWERRFRFPSDTTVRLSTTTGSEWALEDEHKADTLFTQTFTINFTKTNLDTVKSEFAQKILPASAAK
jgi:hypothetical protein